MRIPTLLFFITASLFAGVALVSTGCQRSAEAEHDHHDHHDHDDHDDHGEEHDHEHGHLHSPFKPDDYPSGIARLTELRESLQAENSAAIDQHEALEEMEAIAGFLPELAADSDLDEASWNKVYAAARSLQASLEKVLEEDMKKQANAYKSNKPSTEAELKTLREMAAKFSG